LDIYTYDYLLTGFRNYVKQKGTPFGVAIVEYATSDTTYPHIIFDETRNTSLRRTNTPVDNVSSLAYTLDIFAKTIDEKNNKKHVARELAKLCDEFLTHFGLERISFNQDFSVNESSICHIILTYSGNLFENRRKFI
jgi:hypothetical protein